MKKFLATIALVIGATAVMTAQITISQADKDRAAQIVAKMTLEEKCHFIAGQIDGFHTYAIDRLGIPSVRMADGPQGVRNKTHSTYYPCGISLAATFNRDVAKGVGTGIGFDASARGVRIMLCPGVNIYRSAHCGRNFEYYGEDPYLASETAVNYIEGIQSKRVMATIKHFALNNQEYARHQVNSQAGERAMNEIYFPTFRKAVEQANVAAVMTSYNPVNGTHAAESGDLIKDNLRAWGFEGIVMSDWRSTYTTIGCAESGLDLEMPQGFVLNYESVKGLVENGAIAECTLDEKCMHILQSFIAYGLLDQPMVDSSIPENYDVSRGYALAAANEGPVLLANDGILPIKASKKNNIVVLGPNADIIPFGGGSGAMDPIPGTTTTIRQGLEALGAKTYKTTFIDWEHLGDTENAAIAKASAVVLSVGFNNKTERENSDRTYALPEGQNELIASVAALNPNVIVIINSGGEVDINPWKDSVRAIIMAWYAGQEGGRALASIISGAVSPSGRLPFTFWGSDEANPITGWYQKMTPVIYEASPSRDPLPYTEYKEGVFVGYRGVEHFGVKPMFPFGYGLTYSSFEYSDIKVTPAADGYEVSFNLANKGGVAAAEAAQVYVSPVKPSVVRPDRELKGFAKPFLAKGESKRVSVILPRSAFEHYDMASHSWKADSGEYRILVGASSQDIKLEASVTLD